MIGLFVLSFELTGGRGLFYLISWVSKSYWGLGGMMDGLIEF